MVYYLVLLNGFEERLHFEFGIEDDRESHVDTHHHRHKAAQMRKGLVASHAAIDRAEYRSLYTCLGASRDLIEVRLDDAFWIASGA